MAEETFPSEMAREIAGIPLAARRQLAQTAAIEGIVQNIRALRPRIMVFCGRGSSGQVGVYLRYLFEARLGVLASAAAPSVMTAYKARIEMERCLFIVISQSGRSPDLVASTERARGQGALTLAIVNDAHAPVAEAAECVLPIDAGTERSVAATKTVVLSMVAGARLVAMLARDAMLSDALTQLPARLERALACDWSQWSERVSGSPAAFVTARGYAFATAREIALKVTETLRLPAIAWSAAEIRHGPRAAITPATPVLVLRPNDETVEGVDTLVQDFRQDGETLFVAGGAQGTLPWIGDGHPVCDAIALLVPAYRSIEMAARARGFDPDRPPHLAKVTETL
jgi:glucosamine--fructose-6-phosphate aminotransferase (isomerizing)